MSRRDWGLWDAWSDVITKQLKCGCDKGVWAFSSCSNYFIFSRLETLAGVKANVTEWLEGHNSRNEHATIDIGVIVFCIYSPWCHLRRKSLHLNVEHAHWLAKLSQSAKHKIVGSQTAVILLPNRKLGKMCNQVGYHPSKFQFEYCSNKRKCNLNERNIVYSRLIDLVLELFSSFNLNYTNKFITLSRTLPLWFS